MSRWRNVFGVPYLMYYVNGSTALPYVRLEHPQTGTGAGGLSSKSYYTSPKVPFLFPASSINVHCRQLGSEIGNAQYTRNINNTSADIIQVISFSQTSGFPSNNGIPSNFLFKNISTIPSIQKSTNKTTQGDSFFEFWFTYGADQLPIYIPLLVTALPAVGYATLQNYLPINQATYVNALYSYAATNAISVLNIFNYAGMIIQNTAGTTLWYENMVCCNPYSPIFTVTSIALPGDYVMSTFYGNGQADLTGTEYIRELCRNSPRIFITFISDEKDNYLRNSQLTKRLK